tara:strand:+ start:879 stop:1043 length:165 start_codon:yes stop_codon:yes gene_type:complete
VETHNFETYSRPYKKWAIIVAISIFLSGFILFLIPMVNPITMGMVSIKFLGKFG